MATVQELAREAYDSMETATREDGSVYDRHKENAPEWVKNLIREAHDGMLPDDWRYSAIRSALEAIANSDDPEDGASEFADDGCDIYSSDLYRWLTRSASSDYVQEARDEFGVESSRDLDHEIQMGQYMELSEVYGSVLSSLQDQARRKPHAYVDDPDDSEHCLECGEDSLDVLHAL